MAAEGSSELIATPRRGDRARASEVLGVLQWGPLRSARERAARPLDWHGPALLLAPALVLGALLGWRALAVALAAHALFALAHWGVQRQRRARAERWLAEWECDRQFLAHHPGWVEALIGFRRGYHLLGVSYPIAARRLLAASRAARPERLDARRYGLFLADLERFAHACWLEERRADLEAFIDRPRLHGEPGKGACGAAAEPAATPSRPSAAS